MKRWAIWFVIGIAAAVLAAYADPSTTHAGVRSAAAYSSGRQVAQDAPVFAMLFIGWFAVTVIALPIGIIRWLLKSRPS